MGATACIDTEGTDCQLISALPPVNQQSPKNIRTRAADKIPIAVEIASSLLNAPVQHTFLIVHDFI
jgi:hypothetical protein